MRKISYILSDNGGGDHVTDRWTDAEKFLFFSSKMLRLARGLHSPVKIERCNISITEN